MQNKRKNPRHTCTVPVDAQKGGPFNASKTVDFSQGGLGLISDHKISLNKEIAIQLDLSEEGQSALVVGRVQWVSPIAETNNFRVGVVFKDMVQGSRANVKDYLRNK